MEEVCRVKFFKIFIIFSFLGVFSLANSVSAKEPESEEAFLAAVEAELQNEDYQQTLPEPQKIEISEPDIRIPPWLGSLMKAVFWIVTILFAIYLVYLVAKYWDERNLTQGGGRVKKEKPVRAFQKGTTSVYIPSLEEVEEKAREGHYTEAIHLLLLIALHRVFRFINAPLPEAKTSREILKNDLGVANVGDDLGILVKAVERALFAGKKPNQKNYLACRETFDRLAIKLGESR